MLVPVYDIVNCGPRHRFAANGKLVHNSDGINLQNLPSRGPNAKAIKKCIVAPEGYTVIDADSSQIEARVLAWWAEQDDLTAAFLRKEDVYKKMASKIYGQDEDEIGKTERQVGKGSVLGCFAPDTRVLTNRGWVEIANVQLSDMVWDGVEWVAHKGVVSRGVRLVCRTHGIAATPDHKILTKQGWSEWSTVCTNPRRFQSALDLATSLCCSGSAGLHRTDESSGFSPFVDAPVGGRGSFTEKTSAVGDPHDATNARSAQPLLSAIGSIRWLAKTTISGLAYSTACLRALLAATIRPTGRTNTMAFAAYLSTQSGGKTAGHSCDMPARSPGMTTRTFNSTVSTSTEITAPETSGLLQRLRTPATNGAYPYCRPELQSLSEKSETFDIAYAGPRNRYTILSDRGPLIVHNCGYGMGGPKFQISLKGQYGVTVETGEAARIVAVYRESNPMIVQLWREADAVLKGMARGLRYSFGREGVVHVNDTADGLILPNGLEIPYPNLRFELDEERGREQMVYDTRNGPARIYGPKCVENCTQALARIIVGQQMLKIAKRYRPALTVHDSVILVVPDEALEEAVAYVEECMSWTPPWAHGLPVACEVNTGKTYGDC